MHNLQRSSKDIDHGIAATKKGLSAAKKNFIDQTNLRLLHEDYDKKAVSGNLNQLKPIWSPAVIQIDPIMGKPKRTGPDESAKQMAYSLYGPSRPVIIDHRDELERLNGGKTIICPMCGMNPAKEMDHFAPRGLDSFPEYATHYTNLIPLCHDCNHTKGEQWLDDNGDQIFFNAYFDILGNLKYIDCVIYKDTSTGLLQAKVIIVVNRNENPICRRVHDTLKKLKLDKAYTENVNSQFRTRLNEHLNEYKKESKRYDNIDDYINSKRGLMRDNAADTSSHFLTLLLFSAIAESDLYWDYIREQFENVDPDA